MPQAALTSDQLDRLRGTAVLASRFVNRVRISTCPNTVIYSGRVNQTSFTNAFAQLTYDGGSGTLANVKVGMRVILSHNSDKTVGYWSGRVRKAPTSSILYINETSIAVSDNDYWWVIDDFMIADKLAREVSGVQYNDYDIAFRQLLPVVYDLKSAYAGDIDPLTNKLTLTFEPSAYAAASGASISSWLWNVQDGTITSGSTTTQDITVDFPEGHRWVYLTVTDSGGRTLTRRIEVHAHGSTYGYQLVSVQDVQISADLDKGYDATLTAYAAPDGLLDLTQLTIWSDDSDQTGDGAISGDNILFVGRIRTRDNETTVSHENGLEKRASYSVEGPLTQLSRTEQLAYEMRNVTAPTVWGDIPNMTLYRGIVYLLSEYSTFLELHSLQFDAFNNTYIAPTRNPVGDILTAVKDLAQSINAVLQINGAGQVEIARHACMFVNSASRDALVTRATLTTSDLTGITLKQDDYRPVGRLRAAGGSYNTTTGQYLVSEAIAPGVAQDSGSETRDLDRQVFAANTSQAALDTVVKQTATLALEKEQNVDSISAEFTPQWYSVLLPSVNTWWVFNADTDLLIDGVESGRAVLTSTIRWLLTGVELGLNATGNPSVKGTFIRETTALTQGYTVVYPPAIQSTIPNYPSDPVVPMFPVPPVYLPDEPSGTEVPVPVTVTLPLDGNAWVVMGTDGSAQNLLLTTTMLQMAAPYTRDIAPSDLTATEVGQDLKVNPFVPRGLYALYYDSALETSSIRYTEDCTGYPVTWVKGADFAGHFTELRLGDEDGIVTVFGTVEGAGAGDPADRWLVPFTGCTILSRTATTVTVDSLHAGWDNKWYSGVNTGDDNICGTFTNCTLYRTSDDSLISTDFVGAVACGDTVAVDYGFSILPPVCVNSVVAGKNAGWGDAFYAVFEFGTLDESCGDPIPDVYATRYSTDYGATVADAVTVASSASWIDTQKDGTQVLVGASGQTRKASSGGAYADYGSAKTQGCGFIPRWQFILPTLSNNGSNPQFFLFANALDGGASLWKVSSSGTVFGDITPVNGGNKGLSTGSRCLTGAWQNSSHLLAIGLFDTDRRLAVSVDLGATWHFSGVLNAAAFGIITQRGDHSLKLAGWANGAKVAICRNYQASTPTFVEKELGLTTIYALDVFG